MNTGKTLFAQLMDFLPWTTFTRIVDRYGGDHRVRTLSCAEQYRSMAFAQLTYRESLRDIETCLSVHASKLYHMGFRQPLRRSTLADANERRDWRIHAALAQRLITQARTLYVDEELGLDLTNTVYALDSTTIALCLSVFPWAHFRTTKAAVKMHTLLDLRGNIPSFIHISDGKLHDVHALDMLLPEAGTTSMCCTKFTRDDKIAGDGDAGADWANAAHRVSVVQFAWLMVLSSSSSDQAVLRHVGERGEDGFWNEGNNALPERRLTVIEDLDELGRNPNLALDEAPLAQARAVTGLIVGRLFRCHHANQFSLHVIYYM